MLLAALPWKILIENQFVKVVVEWVSPIFLSPEKTASQLNHYIFENMHAETFLLQSHHHSPCLLIFGQKWEMNLIKI